jgi:PIN domain nuclease of toxin-antitoxin system
VRLLLDTHILIWALSDPDSLPLRARQLLKDKSNEQLFSVVSVWEVSIKHGRGRKEFKVPPDLMRETLLKVGLEELLILGTHAIAVGSLPPIHKDPFDRLLIAQATVEGVTLLTADATIARYPGPIRKV